MRSAQISSGSPMETQTSVYRTSQSFTASETLSVSRTEPPLIFAQFSHFFTSASSGKYFFGAHAVKFSPIFEAATIHELPML